jgi:hypothetical protein
MKHLVFLPTGRGFIAKKLLDAKTARFCGEVFIGYKPFGFIAKKLKTSMLYKKESINTVPKMMTRSQTRQNNNAKDNNAKDNNAKDNNANNAVVTNSPRRSLRLVGRYQEPLLRRSKRLSDKLSPTQSFDETPITMDIVEVRRSERIKQATPVDYIKLSGENSFAEPQDYMELDEDEDYNPKYDLSIIVDDEDDAEVEYIHHQLSELTASPLAYQSPLAYRQYDANIDFDVASVAWRRNKRPIGNGMFAYRSRTN